MADYFILNKQVLDNVLRGANSDRLVNLYFKDVLNPPGRTLTLFTPVLTEAKLFKTEQEARDFGQAHWGLDFFNKSFLIVSAHPKALDVTDNHAIDIQIAMKQKEGK